jgi:hypothetical protein
MKANRNFLFRTTAMAICTLLLATLGAAGAAASDDHWIHGRGENGDDDGEVVTINLPLSLLSAAAAMIPQDILENAHNEAQIALDDVELSWTDLHSMWDQIRNSPDATYMTLQSAEQNLRVWKEGDFLRVGSNENGYSAGTEIDVSFPLAVVDALFSGPDNRLDIGAALQALADYGPGNLVSVRDGEQTVRVWVDDQNESSDR